jgi:hypothetical protein
MTPAHLAIVSKTVEHTVFLGLLVPTVIVGLVGGWWLGNKLGSALFNSAPIPFYRVRPHSQSTRVLLNVRS